MWGHEGTGSRSSLATLRATLGLVGAILQGGRGDAAGSAGVERRRTGPIAEGFGVTDIYRAGGGETARAAILLVHGLTEDGPDDHRIAPFASTCARGGMPVVVPEFPTMRARRMRLEDTEDVARAAAAVPAAAGTDKVVLLAFSYAAGPTLLAAARIAPEILAGTVTVGAYYRLDHLLQFTATGRVASYGRHQPSGGPDREQRLEGQWVFLASAARWLDEAADRGAIAAAAAAWEQGCPPSWEELRDHLGAAGRALVDVITAPDLERLEEARRRLPAGVEEAMRELSPEGRLGALRAPVVLIHGRNDRRIPYRESILLRDELAGLTDVKLAILSAFVHAQRAVGWSRFWRVAADAFKLGRCGFEILGWAV